jgi:hypothetical protein
VESDYRSAGLDIGDRAAGGTTWWVTSASKDHMRSGCIGTSGSFSNRSSSSSLRLYSAVDMVTSQNTRNDSGSPEENGDAAA